MNGCIYGGGVLVLVPVKRIKCRRRYPARGFTNEETWRDVAQSPRKCVHIARRQLGLEPFTWGGYENTYFSQAPFNDGFVLRGG